MDFCSSAKHDQGTSSQACANNEQRNLKSSNLGKPLSPLLSEISMDGVEKLFTKTLSWKNSIMGICM